MKLTRFVPLFFLGFVLFGCGSSNDNDDVDNGSSSNDASGDTADTGETADGMTGDVNNPNTGDSSDVPTDTSGDNTLTIAVVNNGHMVNMQTVAQAYTDQTGVSLNWVEQ